MLQELTNKLIANEDLEMSEARAALEEILSENISDVVIASFLTAFTMKGETAEEIAGFAQTMRNHAVKLKSRHNSLVDTAGTGGGVQTFNISTTAAFVIAGAGIPVAKHGNRAMTSRSGSADVLEELGVNLDAPHELTEKCMNKIGIGFMFAPHYHPAMKRVIPIRRQLAHRTIFNILGPLTNPASAPYQIIGVYSPHLTENIADALAILGCKKAWVIHSSDGMDELSVFAPTRISELDMGKRKTFELEPSEYGFNYVMPRPLSSGLPSENAQTLKSILENKTPGPERDTVVLNAAAAIHLVSEAELPEAISMAEESIGSGAALSILKKLVEMTNA